MPSVDHAVGEPRPYPTRDGDQRIALRVPRRRARVRRHVARPWDTSDLDRGRLPLAGDLHVGDRPEEQRRASVAERE